MLWPALLLSAAAFSVLAYHMVRPNYRTLRVSMSRLMPVPPQSAAPRNKISLTTPITSARFWVRALMLALAALALGPRLWPDPPGDAELGDLRIVLDVSPSMGLAQGGMTRLAEANAIIEDIVTRLSSDPQNTRCIDLVLAGEGTGTALTTANLFEVMRNLEPVTEGRPVRDLMAALTQSGTELCEAPSRALIFTDAPAQPVAPQLFSGAVLWQQIGAPIDNVALVSATLSGGGIGGAAARLELRAKVHGTAPDQVSVRVTGPDGVADLLLRPDGLGGGGWLDQVPISQGGTYGFALLDGGAYPDDDRFEVNVSPPGTPALDWRLSGLPAPSWASRTATDPTDAILVSDADLGADLPDRPFVWAYPGWTGTSSRQIGPFLDQHPLLRTLNLDVFEGAPPAPPAQVPAGLDAVLRPEGLPDTAWIAVRNDPRGAIVPAPVFTDDDRGAMSQVIFFNALRWVSEQAGTGPLIPDWRKGDGTTAVRPWLESETARPLAVRDDPMLVFDLPAEDVATAEEDDAPETWLTAWLIAAACALFALDRIIGANWSRQDARA